jgi:hypothetical protein
MKRIIQKFEFLTVFFDSETKIYSVIEDDAWDRSSIFCSDDEVDAVNNAKLMNDLIKKRYIIAEKIQGNFLFNDDEQVIGFRDINVNHILGSDWIPNNIYIDNSIDPQRFYEIVKSLAEKRFGKLPY